MSHTPEPWSWDWYWEDMGETKGHWVIETENGEHIADVVDDPLGENARLIAAAPELLASLRECLRVVELYAEWRSGLAFAEGERARNLLAGLAEEAKA